MVVGTPGRLLDHLERGAIDASGVAVVVLDEADRMLDLGFREDIEKILGKAPSDRRRVLMLITDAGETTSRADFETARRAALRAEALLYTIIIRFVKGENGRNTAGEHALETIANGTGGAMFYPDDVSQLDSIFDRINRELRTQYRLGYYPQPRPPQGAYRSIEVRVKGNYKVRYRKSYYSGGLAN